MAKEKIYESALEEESLEVDDKPEFEDDGNEDVEADDPLSSSEDL